VIEIPTVEGGWFKAAVLKFGFGQRRSGSILTNSIGYVRLRNAVGSRWCSPRMTRRITMLWCLKDLLLERT
jgi:hypothetical protein